MDRFLRTAFSTLCLLAVAACGALPTTVPTRSADFGNPETYALHETRTYNDGLTVTLERIDDSRCAPNVQCVWAGELAPVLTLRGGALPGARTVSLGTSRTERAQVEEYAVRLDSATTATATITITRGTGGGATAELRVDSPTSGQTVASPLAVRGNARGTWYFEATFPVTLLDANGNRLAQSHATAQGEWMTTDWVPFTASLSFPTPTTNTGTLVLENSNPSGDPARALSVRVPVRFATATAIDTGGTGVRGSAHVGPTCPVERTPPDPACADRAYAGNFVIETVGGNRVAEFTTASDGRYSVALPPGSYQVRLRDANAMPSMAAQPFTVRDGWSQLDLALDSGIR
jgi:Immunoglobulin-like domain of bacterial spore germination